MGKDTSGRVSSVAIAGLVKRDHWARERMQLGKWDARSLGPAGAQYTTATLNLVGLQVFSASSKGGANLHNFPSKSGILIWLVAGYPTTRLGAIGEKSKLQSWGSPGLFKFAVSCQREKDFHAKRKMRADVLLGNCQQT